MSDNSAIEWTDATWSPIRAIVKADAPHIAMLHGWKELAEICEKMVGHVGPHCEFISAGCNHCYSCTNNHRCLPSNGTGLPFDKRSRELVDIFVDEKILTQPLRWKRGRKIFVENQSDLFGEWVTDEQIDRVFAVMALTPQHTYQVLTKRPERMLAYLGLRTKPGEDITQNEEDLVLRWGAAAGDLLDGEWIHGAGKRFRSRIETFISHSMGLEVDGEMLAEDEVSFPLPNVWLGVSVENQEYADERIPLLLETPAVVRFVSYEPALEGIDLRGKDAQGSALDPYEGDSKLNWVIVGGESGQGARPFDIAWARSVVEQCQESGVPVFVKQLGAKPRDILRNIKTWEDWRNICHQLTGEGDLAVIEARLKSKKGGDMSEWPADLRIRQFPV